MLTSWRLLGHLPQAQQRTLKRLIGITQNTGGFSSCSVGPQGTITVLTSKFRINPESSLGC